MMTDVETTTGKSDRSARHYLQSINDIFKENRLAKGRFVALGQTLAPKNVTAPAYPLRWILGQ
jgi:poly(3-hydroxybutyrate) depolymerase